MADSLKVMDLSLVLERQKVPAETILFLQGRKVGSLLMLHSGMAEIMNTDIALEGASPDSIIEESTRVGLVKGESVCGIIELYNNQALGHSIHTVSDCIITNRPVDHELIVQTLQQNMKLNLQVLHALIQRVESAIFLFRNYRYLWHKFASIQDSLALCAEISRKRGPSEETPRYKLKFAEYASYLDSLIDAQGEKRPAPWDAAVFFGSLQDKLSLYTQYDNLRIEEMVDHPQYLFIKRLLNKQTRLVAALLYKDGPTNSYMFQFLNNILEQLVKYNKDIACDIKRLVTILYGTEGWVPQLIKRSAGNNQRYLVFMQQLWKYSWSCHKDAFKLLRINLPQKYPSYKKLLDFRALAKTGSEADLEPSGTIMPEMRANLGKYKGLLAKILQFSDKSREFKDEFTELLTKIKALKDIQSTEKEALTLRSRFTTLYWELYETCFLKVIDSDLKSFIPGIMLHFGLIDEGLVTETELAAIDKAYSGPLALDEPIPAMTLPYFLERIYTGDINPSMSETGESFREVLQRQEKMSDRERRAAELIYTDNPEDKVRYEIRMVACEVAKSIHGSKQKSLPVLNQQSLVGNINHLILSPEKCSEISQTFRSRDYGLFYREIVCKHRFGTDIVKNEILPHFVIYPVSGSRAMMWQELDGTKKNTPARFMIPLFFMGKCNEDIGTLLGQFRWELARAVAGTNWMDPVEGGMAGAYYDYLTFYKRNPHLTSTHKEYLKDFIKKTRSDRDRFSADYLTWMLYEYEGRPRFNPVARDIFYRFAPFRREIRVELAKKPLYTDLETKRENRNRKEILRLESRFKRFEKANETLPPEMEKYMQFLKL